MKTMKAAAFLLLLALSAGSVSAAEPASLPFAAAAKANGKWGVIDGSGNLIVPAVYDAAALSLSDAETMSEDLASDPCRESLIEVRLKGKRGFYDRTGKSVVPVSYENRSVWTEGMLAVRNEEDKVLFYRTDGTRVGGTYDQVSDFRNGMAIVKTGGKYGYLAADGTEIAPVYKEARYFEDGLAPVRMKDLWGVIDTKGNTAVAPAYKDTGPFYSDGLLAVKNKKDRWGFIDTMGTEKVPLIYRSVVPVFSEHLTAVQNEEKQWGFLDSSGAVTAEPRFRAVLTPFSEGLAGVSTVDGRAYVHPDGTVAFAADYTQLFPFDDGLAEVRKGEIRPSALSGGFPVSIGIGWGWGPRFHHRRHHHPRWGWGIGFPVFYNPPYTGYDTVPTVAVKRGYIDSTGKVIAAPSNDRVFDASEKGILVQNDGRYGWVNRGGTYIAHTVYKSLIPEEAAGFLLARDEENRWGTLSMETGKPEIPFLYKELRYIGSDLLAYKEDKKWGIIGKDGTVITAARYEAVSVASEGFIPVKDSRGWKYIGTDGADRIAPAEPYFDATPFSRGRAGVRIGDRWTLIDTEGHSLLPPTYEALHIL